MPKTRNPFYRGYTTGYNNPAMGQAAQSLGAMLTAGPSPYALEDRESKMRLNTAHEGAYRATAAKHGAEAAGQERQNALMSDDEIFNSAWAAEGGDHRLPSADIQAALDADPTLRGRVARRYGAIRQSNQVSGKTNSHQLEQGITEHADRTLGQDVLAGTRTAGSVGEMVAARGGKPLRDVKDDTNFSRFLAPSQAPMVTTQLGGAKIEERGAASRQHDAAAGNQRAQAGEHGARTTQINQETRTGIKIGAPVLVNDPEAGPMYTAPQSAPGRAPAAMPRDHAPRSTPRAPGEKTADQVKLLNSYREVARQSVGIIQSPKGVTQTGSEDVSPDVANAIAERALEINSGVTNPTAPQISAAVERARREVFQQNTDIEPGTTRWFGPNDPKKRRMKKGSVGSMVAPAGAAPQPKATGGSQQLLQEANDAIARGADPAAVRARLRSMGVQVSD